ncbi:hypothetical protein Pcinc_035893 [Petrolisthes cinctipes]|uniref:Aminopeptidase N n=1 Tax=Petrolisthes cinctipes TaxID=88211 RepID=A0AAE1BXC6_PETCI|nr:hypothetical protein Pcinc_035893 [Petrolisthes cinctipes]
MLGEVDKQHERGHNSNLSFGKAPCCYLSREAGVLLGVLMLGVVVGTGLLVHYLAPHTYPNLRIIDRTTPHSQDLEMDAFPPPRQVKRADAMTTSKPHSSHHPSPPSPTPPTPTTSTQPEVMKGQKEESLSGIEQNTETEGKQEMTHEERMEWLRLPLSLKPLHYLVKLQPLINGNFSILGYVEVEVEVLEATTNFTLHIADIITNNNTVKVMESGVEEVGLGREVVIRRHQYDHEREFYIAHLEEALQKGNKYTLSMEFIGLLNDQLHGFYRSNYRNANGTEVWLASTQFQANDARRAFPCFDEPGLKATFEIHLARQTNMTTISNMPIKETRHMVGAEGWVWDHYYTTVPMSTYLLAFVVSDLAHNSTDLDDILFRVWTREEALPQANYALDIGPRILTFFTDYFNLSYPLPKLDMVAVPDFPALGMENWGLVIYSEIGMLYEAGVSSAANKQLAGMVVSHELAHQWFGDLVTPKWWSEIWLNEGFASYVEHLGIDHIEPSWKILEQFVIRRMQGVFVKDSLHSSNPVIHNAMNGNTIIYSKGASIIRMMNHFLGDGTFRSGVSDYLSTLKYDNAVSDDLWEHLTLAAHRDGILPTNLTVKTIMDTWTLQMGYPVITVQRNNDGDSVTVTQRNNDGNSVTVTQERFLLTRQENSEDTHDYKWWVPLTYTDQAEADFSQTQPKVWMKDSEAQITIPHLATKDHWVIFNLHQTGYYRVNYDLHNWHLLTSQLLSQHTAIATINRAQIIDDAMDLARAGLLPYATALDLLGYLPQERDYVPWWAAFENLKFLKNMLTYTAGYGPFKRYVRDLVLPLYSTMGLDDHLDDPVLDQYKRQKVVSWACFTGLPDCLQHSLAAFNAWRETPHSNNITANLKSTVYCHAIAEGGEEEWSFAWHQYLESNVGTEKDNLLGALGCSKKPWILARYLEMAFNESSGIKKQDARTVFRSVARNEVGQPLAWTFLQDNFDRIHAYSANALKGLMRSVTTSFNRETQLKELESLHAAHKGQVSSNPLDMMEMLERVRHNVDWTQRHYQEVMAWLQHRGYHTTLPTHHRPSDNQRAHG